MHINEGICEAIGVAVASRVWAWAVFQPREIAQKELDWKGRGWQLYSNVIYISTRGKETRTILVFKIPLKILWKSWGLWSILVATVLSNLAVRPMDNVTFIFYMWLFITRRTIYRVQIWVFGVQIYSDITWFNNWLHSCRQRAQL